MHADSQGAETAIREGIRLMRALEDFSTPVDGPIRIYADNRGQIAQTKNLSLSDRAKHYDIQVHFVRERVEASEFSFKYTPTAEQTADIFTSPSPGRYSTDSSTNSACARSSPPFGPARRKQGEC